ncbi:MAG: AmmeMemoRadiSam system protein A [Acidobacteria bacterium]|nr:AmmeMemoRadiSam system protein A [Acidobacteriota bacterium]
MSLLNAEEKTFLLRLARKSLEAAVRHTRMEIPAEVPPAVQIPAGAFVSLHKRGHLRGCIGYIQPAHPLHRTVIEAAMASALHDTRFEPVRPEELPEIEIEISVLSPLQEVRPEEVQVGGHGLMVSQGEARGLLLPQVAVGHHWQREQFLEETCRKADLPADAWRRGAKIEAFTAEVFNERFLGFGQPEDSWTATPALPHRPEKLPPG